MTPGNAAPAPAAPPHHPPRTATARPAGPRRPRWVLIGIAAVIGLVVLFLLPIVRIPLIDTPQVSFASVLFYPIGIYVLLAVGLDMTVGRTGQLNLGYAAFFAGGAYTTALLTTSGHLSYYATIIPAIVVAMVLGLLVGVVSLRVGGDYFAIVTLGIGLVVQEVVANVGIFGTTVGISSIPPPSPIAGLTFSVSNPKAYDWLLFAMIIVVCLVFSALYRSPIGRAWSAIREDEGAAELMGVKVRKLKVLASTVGAAPGGLAGSLYAAEVGYISPETFGLTLSILILAAVTLGGKGRIAGVILGGVIVGYLPERFLAVDKIDTLLFGIVLVLVMLFRPEGILGSMARRGAVRDSPRRNLFGLLGRRALRIDGDARGVDAPSARPSGPTPDRGPVARTAAQTAVQAAAATPARTHDRPTPPDPTTVGPDGADGAAGTAAPGAGTPALTVDRARVAFGGVVALDDVSLTVDRGVVTSVIGPNGAGKTTLVNAVTGVYRLSGGRVCLGDHDVSDAPVARRSWMGLGRTFQNIRLFGGLTALENVLVAAEALRRADPARRTDRPGEGRRPGRARNSSAHHNSARNSSAHNSSAHHSSASTDRALDLLETVGLAAAATTRADQLPYGAQRRLEIARALALDPTVLLLDEPAAGANTAEKREMTELIGEIARSGRSVLLIEHDMRLVMEISAAIVVLNFGKVIAQGPPDRIRRDPAVIAAYLGEGDRA